MLYTLLQEKPFLIAGPCVIESEALVLQIAERMVEWQSEFPDFCFVFKASFDKANRTAIGSFRGGGMERGLDILARVKARTGLPVLTDIHESIQAAPVAAVVDILQIPAFLCRQTDLLVAAAETGAIINIKKAQFLSAADMRYVLQKPEAAGNRRLLLTERGTAFGYNNLVVDFTGLSDLRDYGYPVVLDATHSVQKPGGAEGKSGGNRRYAPMLAYAAAAVGLRGFFAETHPDPERALSDGPNMLFLNDIPTLLRNLRPLLQLQPEPLRHSND